MLLLVSTELQKVLKKKEKKVPILITINLQIKKKSPKHLQVHLDMMKIRPCATKEELKRPLFIVI